MEQTILVPGELIGVLLQSLMWYKPKFKDRLSSYQVKSGDTSFIPCIYQGTNKHGEHILVVLASSEAKEDQLDSNQTELTNIKIKVKPKFVDAVFSPLAGVVHGTVGSLPSVIPVPGFPNVGVKLHIEADQKFKFTHNIDKNINAVAKYTEEGFKTRALIYGPSSSGKSSLAETLADKIGTPWVSVSPKWLAIGSQGAMSALAFVMTLARQRGLAVIFDDIDELLGIMANGGDERDADGSLGLAAHYFILDAMKSHPTPLIFTAVGKFSIDHIISQCNVFFSLHFGSDDMKQIWSEICPTAKELGEEIADEGLPLAMLFAMVKQAGMIAKASGRKNIKADDVKTALTCFGKRAENKPGFGR